MTPGCAVRANHENAGGPIRITRPRCARSSKWKPRSESIDGQIRYRPMSRRTVKGQGANATHTHTYEGKQLQWPDAQNKIVGVQPYSEMPALLSNCVQLRAVCHLATPNTDPDVLSIIFASVDLRASMSTPEDKASMARGTSIQQPSLGAPHGARQAHR